MEFSEEILQAALEGLLLKKDRVESQIELVKSLLSKKPGAVPSNGSHAAESAATSKPPVRRVISPEARQRIIDAQKRRWALRRQEASEKKDVS